MPTKIKKKPNKRITFKSLVARIERSNKNFKRAGQAKKIMMVAQDVLDMLRLRRIKAVSGSYVQLSGSKRMQRKAKDFTDMSELLKLPVLPACEVCAIGAGMIAATLRLDHVPIERDSEKCVQTSASFEENNDGTLSGNMSERAMDVFPEELLRKMEYAFEHNYYEYTMRSPTARLEAIYENLVKNKGLKFTNYDDHTETAWSA